MNRCILVATDGSVAAQSALRYAMDFAAATNADEIACLCVREHERRAEVVFATSIAAPEMALAAGCAGPVLIPDAGPEAACRVDPDTVLDACSDVVAAAGFRFTPITCSEPVSALLRRLGDFCQTLFVGRTGIGGRSSSNLGSTVTSVLERVPQMVTVCPREYQAIQRVVIAHSGRGAREPMIEVGAKWAKAFGVPLLMMTTGSSPADASRRQAVIQDSLARLGRDVPCESYCCQPAELADRVGASDLLLVGRHVRWWPVRLCFGSNTEAILQRATGPVAVLPSEVS